MKTEVEGQNQTIQLARQIATQIAERATDADRTGLLPPEDVRLLRESGYLTLNIPLELGGMGLNMRDCVMAQLELAQGNASTAIVAAMQLQVFGLMRLTYPADVYERLCHEAVNGGLFNSVASEPRLGSPSRGGQFETAAVPHSDGWCIKGHKTWITGGRHLTHLLVKLQVEDDPGVMLIAGDTPGLNWEPTWQHALSLRASETNDLHLENVLVPTENLLQRGHAEEPPNAWFPMMLAAVYLGSAIAARNTVIQFALERVPTALGKPIATLPKIQRQIGKIDMSLQAAQALLLEVASLSAGDNMADIFPRVAAAKHFAVETANTVTEQALYIAGGQSINGALPLERYFRDVRAGSTQPPAGDTALEIIGRHTINTNKGAVLWHRNGSNA